MLGEPGSAQVIYRSDAVRPRHQVNSRVSDPLDLLAEMSAHIPDPHEKTTLFYDWYSNGSAELATKPDTGSPQAPRPARERRRGGAAPQ